MYCLLVWERFLSSCFFFFSSRRRHTRLQGDWSSDVCSSDLQLQDGCVYCGNCMLGCHVHAKNTLDLNYIPLAEQNGAEVYPLHLVEKIEPVDPVETNGYRVHFKHYDTEKRGEYVPGTVVGRKVVVSAGSLGSTELLLRSRNLHKTLPNISPMLGEKFSGNGDFLLAG